MTESLSVLFLSKLLPLFVSPLGMALLLASAGGFFALRQHAKAAEGFIASAIAMLWICATPACAEWALGTLEQQNPPRAIADLPNADVAIVLGGALGGAVKPRVTIDLSDSSDRVLHAARLYRAGKVKKILVTGGNIPWMPGEVPEAVAIRDLLIEWGVPPDSIVFAGASRNTYENALEIRALRETTPFASALLVTSAAHMPRALAVFKRAGLPVAPATTDVEVVEPGPWTPLRWLPDATALSMTSRAVREWIGWWAYRTRGYL